MTPKNLKEKNINFDQDLQLGEISADQLVVNDEINFVDDEDDPLSDLLSEYGL